MDCPGRVFFFSRLWQNGKNRPSLPPRSSGLPSPEPSFHHAHSVDFDSTKSMGWSASARAGLFCYFLNKESRERMSARFLNAFRPSKKKTANIWVSLFRPVSWDGKHARRVWTRSRFDQYVCKPRGGRKATLGLARGRRRGEGKEVLELSLSLSKLIAFCLARQHLFLPRRRRPPLPPLGSPRSHLTASA